MKEHSRAEFSISCLTCNSQCICFQVMMNLLTSPWGHSCSITLHPKFDHFYWLNCCLTRIQYRTQNPQKFLEARQGEYPVHICKKGFLAASQRQNVSASRRFPASHMATDTQSRISGIRLLVHQLHFSFGLRFPSY